MNNIVNMITQIMMNGQNPNQIVQQMIQQNPQAQVLFNQMQQSGMSIKDFTMQYAKQNNLNLEQIINVLSQRGIKF
jgi:ABC-type branched-subunit amino acid transport system substrate-binding protein